MTLTVSGAAEVLGISRGLAYRCANRFLETNGEVGLPVVRLGRRMLVPTLQLRRLLKGELSLEGDQVAAPLTAPLAPAVPAASEPSGTRAQPPKPATMRTRSNGRSPRRRLQSSVAFEQLSLLTLDRSEQA